MLYKHVTDGLSFQKKILNPVLWVFLGFGCLECLFVGGGGFMI